MGHRGRRDGAACGGRRSARRRRGGGGDGFAPGQVCGEPVVWRGPEADGERPMLPGGFFSLRGGRAAEEGNGRGIFRKDGGAASRLVGDLGEWEGGVGGRMRRRFWVTEKKRLLTSAAWGLFALPCSGCSVAW